MDIANALIPVALGGATVGIGMMLGGIPDTEAEQVSTKTLAYTGILGGAVVAGTVTPPAARLGGLAAVMLGAGLLLGSQ